uniref:ATP-binding cassette transporter subfamily B member 1-like X8 protein n=1 Tax=Brachionus koreanus TaxID=1199090 RepID=A0A1J0MMW5_9BILA|nr:ATP-binding cassette transporter subfamily B member 1-like X8 protein [Brachionus koreanus]
MPITEKYFSKCLKWYCFKTIFKEHFKYASKFDMFLICLGTLAAIFSSLIFPFVLIILKSDAEITNDNETLFEIIYIYAGLALLSVWIVTNKKNKIILKNLNPDKIQIKILTGIDFRNRVDIEIISTAIGFKLSEFIYLVCRGIACTIFAFIQAWKFSLLIFSILPFVIISLIFMSNLTKKYTLSELNINSEANSIAQEALSSFRTVISLGIQKSLCKNFDDIQLNGIKIAKKKGLIVGLFTGLFGFLSNIVFGICIFYGIYLTRYESELFLPEDIIKSFLSLYLTIFSIGQALPFLKEFAEAIAASKVIFEIIERKPDDELIKQQDGTRQIENFKGDIEFDNVYFSYPSRSEKYALNGLSFKIPAGKTVALVGSSGGGKSTVVSLLQRFYLPKYGSIKIDGYPIDSLDINWFRNQIALVSQEPILFTDTIRENIRLGKLNANDKDVEKAAKDANAHDFILRLKDEYGTKVGERGTQLSGGQKQRIAIARGLVRQPRVFLFDEATAALDNESEKMVLNCLDEARKGRTTIIIAHRLSTISKADIILYISNGQLLEQGTHEELLAKQGEYFKLIESQLNRDNKQITDECEFKSQIKDCSDIRIKHQEPNRKKNEKNKKNHNLFYYERKLFKLNLPNLFWLLVGLLSASIAGLLDPATNIVFLQIYNLFAIEDANKQKYESLKFMLILFLIGILSILIEILQNFTFSLIGSKLTKQIRSLMFKSMLSQEMAFHDMENNCSNILTTQLSTSALLCRGLFSDKIRAYSQCLFILLFSLIYSFSINWKLSLVLMIFFPITFLIGVFSNTRLNIDQKINGRYLNEEAGRIAIECFENIKTVFSLNRQGFFVDKFCQVFSNKKSRKALLLDNCQAFFYSLSNSIMFFVQLSAFSYGYYLLKNNELSLAHIFSIYNVLIVSAMIIANSFSQLPDQKKALNATKMAFEIIERKSKLNNFDEQGLVLDTIAGDIKFDNVFFNYPNRPDVQILSGFNLELKNGTTNALVGSSGCGKSTIIALLLRFYDVDKGAIYLDGVDIRKLNINWLRSITGLVGQEPILFNLSIYDNICLGDINRNKAKIEINEIIDICTSANIHYKIESLPEKYDTIVGSKGGQLSGGEKQRIAIARALIRKPKILLLDEATSALFFHKIVLCCNNKIISVSQLMLVDNQSESLVKKALDEARIGRTCVIIAHSSQLSFRLSTIENSSKISYVENGKIVEEANFQKKIRCILDCS